MAAKKVVGTMSTDGWVVGVKQRIDRLFAYWLANQKSQSYLCRDSIASFQYDIQQHTDNPEALAATAGRNLQTYLEGHFDAVTVVAQIKFPAGQPNTTFYQLEFDIKLREGDIGYDVGRTLVEVNNGVFKQIVKGQ
ncbi:hypothetical protein pEaSNUABM37_00272 [Erwinia phage pEa_SNUABM_37]|nr:hypothetical protein pEaSNUABM37_00272 [Erwinia phage pEa_SNUABM_37]QXO10740.1 hypothetical protein pEaSNUABM48_00272 [Erwinia phage pEa_SNUABM_48]